MSSGGTVDTPALRRFFVALWPAPEVRARLDQVADVLALNAPRSRRVAASNFHLTLAFVGHLQHDRVDELTATLLCCASQESQWSIDRVGYFDRARVVWAGGPANEALRVLADDVRRRLDALQIAYDRKPFAPHVTLLRNVARWTSAPTPIVFPLAWPFDRPTLVRSERKADGVSYVPIPASLEPPLP
jgi:2'-5' RNA ligase